MGAQYIYSLESHIYMYLFPSLVILGEIKVCKPEIHVHVAK